MNREETLALAATELATYGEATIPIDGTESVDELIELMLAVKRQSRVVSADGWPCGGTHLHLRQKGLWPRIKHWRRRIGRH